MNQILLTEDVKNDKKNDKRSYNEMPKAQKQKVKNVSTNSNDIKKTIIFFGIIIIVFGLAFGGIYVYKLNSKKNDGTISDNGNNPQITLEEDQSNSNQFVLKASSAVGLDKVIYIFDGEKQEEDLNGRTTLETTVTVPAGTKKAEIQVVDMNGKVDSTSKTFGSNVTDNPDKPTDPNTSSGKPKIETSIVEDGKLKIIASSENPMKYITYSWNDEEKNTINAEEDENEIEAIIDVKRGKNEITIIAVDTNNKQNTQTKTFNGVNNPIIDIVKDGDKLYIKVSHDMGIKKIKYDYNGSVYNYDENYAQYDPNKTEVEFYFPLKEGENNITVTATSSEGTEEVRSGSCDYQIEEE